VPDDRVSRKSDDGGLSPDVRPTPERAARHGFHDLELLTFDWSQERSAHEFAAYRGTTSQLLVLPAAVREQLVHDVARAVENRLDGSFHLPWRTHLFLARRV
jgi:hypothetical protein